MNVYTVFWRELTDMHLLKHTYVDDDEGSYSGCTCSSVLIFSRTYLLIRWVVERHGITE